MNHTRLTCVVCSAPVFGEPGPSYTPGEECENCGRCADTCSCEKWASHCWYLDGEDYVCSCGARLLVLFARRSRIARLKGGV